jgi:hypothetical protein
MGAAMNMLAVRPGPPDHRLLPPAPARYGPLNGG